MPKRKNPDLPNQTSRDGTQVGFRLTPNEGIALDRLVEHKRKTLATSGIPMALHGQLATRSMLLRSWIEERAKELGLWPQQDAPEPVQAPSIAEVQPVPLPVPAVDPRQLVIPNLQSKATEAPEPVKPESLVHEPPKPTKKANPLDEAQIKARLRSLPSSSLAVIAEELGVASSTVCCWRNKQKIIPERCKELDAALQRHGC